MSRIHYNLPRALALALVMSAGCQGGQSAEESASPATASEERREEPSAAARFDKDLRKRTCELLSPGLVSRTFGVPEGELKQLKVMGCTYTWKSDSEELEASVTMVRAHASEAAAAQWFQNATADKTAEQIA